MCLYWGSICGRWTVGLDNHGGLFQPLQFYDFMILGKGQKTVLHLFLQEKDDL